MQPTTPTIAPKSAEQLRAIATILDAIAADCARLLTATLSEHHAKAIAVDALLRSGFGVVEGSNRPGQGRLLALGADDRLTDALVPLPRSVREIGSLKQWTSPDIRVATPAPLVVELQARSIHGSQSALFSANILDDLHRVIEGRADVFVLVADRRIYDALRGQKTSRRGSAAKHPLVFANVLPELEGDGYHEGLAVSGLLPFRYQAIVTPSPAGGARVVLAWWYDPSARGESFEGADRVRSVMQRMVRDDGLRLPPQA